MAQDLEQLVLSISADTRQMQRAINRIVSDTQVGTKRVEAHFNNLGRNLERSVGRSFAKVGSTFRGGLAAIGVGIGARDAQGLVDAATRIDNALKVAGLSGENLEKVYQSLKRSAMENAAPLETLVELYGRAAMAADNLGASQSDLDTFAKNVAVSLRVSGKSAQEASGALLQLSQLLSGSVVQAQEYNSLIDGAYPLLQAVAAGLKEAGGDVGKLTQLVKSGKVPTKAFFDAFQAGAPILQGKVASAVLTIDQRFANLRTSLIDAARRFNSSTKVANTFGEAIDNVSSFVNGVDFDGLIDEIGKIIEQFRQGVRWANNFAASIGEATGLDAVGEFLTGGDVKRSFLGGALTVSSPRALRNRLDTAFNQPPQAGGTLTEEAIRNWAINSGTAASKTSRLPAKGGFTPTAVSLEDYELPDDKGSKRKTAADRFNDDIQSIRDRTAALKEEQATLRLSFEEQERRKISLELEQQALADLREEARRKGEKDVESIQLSAEQRKAIDEVATAYARQADELRKANELFELERDVLEGIFGDLRSALDDGKLEWQEFADVALNALDKVIDKILNDLISAILEASDSAGGLKGILGSLLGGIFGGGVNLPSTAPIPTPAPRANGGPVTAGQPYIVGERRPELFVPNQSGMILPRIPSGNASSVFSPSFSIDARGAQPGVGPEIQSAIKQAMDQMRREFPMNTAKALKTIRVMGYQ